jgi:hypothetical protein
LVGYLVDAHEGEGHFSLGSVFFFL